MQKLMSERKMTERKKKRNAKNPNKERIRVMNEEKEQRRWEQKKKWMIRKGAGE